MQTTHTETHKRAYTPTHSHAHTRSCARADNMHFLVYQYDIEYRTLIKLSQRDDRNMASDWSVSNSWRHYYCPILILLQLDLTQNRRQAIQCFFFILLRSLWHLYYVCLEHFAIERTFRKDWRRRSIKQHTSGKFWESVFISNMWSYR